MRGLKNVGIALVALTVGATVQSASAATLKVSKTGDPIPGACTANDCSLREAVRRANTSGGPDRIVLKAKTYRLTQEGQDEDEALTGDLDVLGGSGKLTITGRGAKKTTIAAGVIDRIFDTFEGSSVVMKKLELEGSDFGSQGGLIFAEDSLTISRSALRSGFGSHGGAIFAFGDTRLRISRSTFTGNEATFGGALYHNNESVVTVSRSLFRRNEVSFGGGAIYNQNDARMTVKNSVFERNRAFSGEGGGAIFNQNAADALIIGSTISKNTAADAGGGIFVKNQSDMTVVNSTVSGNRADRGGGIFVWQQAHINVLFSTVADNTALSAGGGVFDTAEPPGPPSPPYLTFQGSIVAANHAPGGSENCLVTDPGNWLTEGGNLEGETDSCQFTLGSDEADANARLRKLARNGGPTKTHALKPSSDAVNAAPKQGCPKRDQRGVKRPQGNRCDSGSYELKQR